MDSQFVKEVSDVSWVLDKYLDGVSEMVEMPCEVILLGPVFSFTNLVGIFGNVEESFSGDSKSRRLRGKNIFEWSFR
jgi:hypothetical protein